MLKRICNVRQLAIALAVIAILVGGLPLTIAAQDATLYWPTGEWRTTSPDTQGLERKRLKKLVKRIRKNKIRDLNSLLIVRNGYLVTEAYFNGSGPDDVHTLQSDTKSVTSLLVGIALQQGKIGSIHDRVLDYFPEYPRIKHLDERKAAMTLQDLLTMRTGLDWSEDPYQGSPLEQLNICGCDWPRLVLNWPMREMPGTRFEYNSGGVILLGGIIRNVAGTSVDDFARQYLFAPLGITDAWWYQGLPAGLPHMGGGLNLRARDMAKLGYLVLRKGRWDNQQVVSAAWLEESLQHAVRRPRTFASHTTDYGYLWWLLPLDGIGASDEPDADIYTASGARDQWIFVIPKYDMVIVVTGNTSSTFAQPVDFLYTDILPAVQ